MMDLSCGHEKFDPFKKFRDYIKYKIAFAKEHPDYFYADGLLVFCGPQGSGKTLSAVNYTFNILNKYPKCKLVTNLMLKDYPIVTFEEFLVSKYGFDDIKLRNVLNNNSEFDLDELKEIYLKENKVFPFDNDEDFKIYNNGEFGVLYLVDEIHLYLNSLESKNVNLEVVSQISQQRKQRKHIVCTSQVFGRMAKPLREQFSVVCKCSCVLSCIQYNQIIDRDSIDDSVDDGHVEGNVKRKFLYLHSPMYYKRYDTYYTISKNKFISNEKKVGDIYGTSKLANND